MIYQRDFIGKKGDAVQKGKQSFISDGLFLFIFYGAYFWE